MGSTVTESHFEGDRELVRRMSSGDESAFEDFFEGHFSRLFRFSVARLGGDAVTAEEVVQASLCLAVARLETWRGEASLFTWLCTICRHEIGRHLRRRGRDPIDLSVREDSAEARAALESIEASLEGPEASIGRDETARRVQAALDSLPSHYASALEWKYLQGLPVDEIAARLRMGAKAAESLLTRARGAFRDVFTALSAPSRDSRPSGAGHGGSGGT